MNGGILNIFFIFKILRDFGTKIPVVVMDSLSSIKILNMNIISCGLRIWRNSHKKVKSTYTVGPTLFNFRKSNGIMWKEDKIYIYIYILIYFGMINAIRIFVCMINTNPVMKVILWFQLKNSLQAPQLLGIRGKRGS